MGDMKLSAKHTVHAQPEGYQEPHNEGSRAHPALAHRWDLNWIFQVCVLPVILLGQPPHMKKKKNDIKNKNLIVVYLARTY